MTKIIITRKNSAHERMSYWFDDGGKLRSVALQRLGHGRGHWRNDARWVPPDNPAVPKDVLAEVKKRLKNT